MSVLDQVVMPRLRDYWMRLALRRVHYADRPDKLDRLYCLKDPWRMDSAREQARFAWVNDLIAAELAPVETILEIGCGEAHQSQHLSRVCRALYGIDVSARAVRRAARRCPTGRFAAGDPQHFSLPGMPPKVDLVTACEVIYYVKDVPAFLARLAELGKACLVTYYQGQAPALEPYLAAIPIAGRAQYCFEGVEWNAIWWHADKE